MIQPDDRDPFEQLSREETEFEQWLTEQEKQTVANIEEHLNRMFKQYFGENP